MGVFDGSNIHLLGLKVSRPMLVALEQASKLVGVSKAELVRLILGQELEAILKNFEGRNAPGE